jgi:hypothetical protein
LGQSGKDLQNHKLHVILHMQQSLNFASLPFEKEKEFGVVSFGKVVHIHVVLDEVQSLGKV